MAYIIFIKSLLVHVIVEQSHSVDMLQLEVPVRTLWCLLTYGICGIEERTIFEKLLICILHLHDKFLSSFILAINIKNGLAFGKGITHMFTIQVFHVLDYLKALKERVQEIDEQILVGFCTENALETEIGQQTDVSFLCLFHILLPPRAKCLGRKVTSFWKYHQT